MISIRHIGIYVKNIEYMTEFYKNVFQMVPVCEKQKDKNELLDELLKYKNTTIITTKLITPTGEITGQGDMIELVKVMTGPYQEVLSEPVYNIGVMHIAIGVEDIQKIMNLIIKNGGCQKTAIVTHINGNQFAFATDPEGNWIELIERH